MEFYLNGNFITYYYFLLEKENCKLKKKNSNTRECCDTVHYFFFWCENICIKGYYVPEKNMQLKCNHQKCFRLVLSGCPHKHINVLLE